MTPVVGAAKPMEYLIVFFFQTQVSYKVHDRGDHIMIIKWGEDHIPGSPFSVNAGI